MNEVSLASLITPSKTITMEFPGFEGLTVDLCHLAREELVKIRKKCTKTGFSRTTHKPEETLDEDKFLKEYCTAIIKGWKGFKFKYLEELLLVDISSLDPEDELPATLDNIILLMKNSDRFEVWVSESVSTLENFTKRK